ncbi:GNAT family N-acetyltransferase [Vibrio natriegens]|uniref:GNAT family N-acetyltransferase n=1 Tax=Vibrio natriegens TaxID=691 RepID=UPI001594CB8E|nr:GNAT family N-acetyltransferase [Vibrio natriegens]NVC95947.1 GNAT family N-acetyltransferase [Vibrio natriegens]
MISIEKYSDKWKSQVGFLSVKQEQAEFTVSNVDDVIPTLQQHEHPFLIIENDKVVGFFLLDLSYSETYNFGNEKALGIRSLLIDQRSQGKGIATQAIKLLPDYVRSNYPDFQSLELTVNCRNKAAYHCYSKCGFADTGKLYLGGPAGPQHIMQRDIV